MSMLRYVHTPLRDSDAVSQAERADMRLLGPHQRSRLL